MSGKRISLDYLVRDVSSNHRITLKESREIVLNLFEVIRRTMADGGSVHIPDFGVFYAVTKPAGFVMNPCDGKQIYRDQEKQVPKVRFSTRDLR